MLLQSTQGSGERFEFSSGVTKKSRGLLKPDIDASVQAPLYKGVSSIDAQQIPSVGHGLTLKDKSPA
jgi:hypothetical protein|tara:strand:+ start:857 stop:1057 length:201 start_codon:yes stop_codon:yes gene_type:complete